MDALKQQLARIQQQLGGLSASQKMLTASLVAIMILTLVWIGGYAGKSDMEPLLDQTLKADELDKMRTGLAGRGIPFTISGGKLLVPSDRKDEALAGLSLDQALPTDTHSSFDEMFDRTSSFDSQTRTEAAFQQAKQMELARMIKLYPGIANATVMIDIPAQMRIGRNNDPTAAVTIVSKPGARLDVRRTAQAAASLVSGAISGMKKEKVEITIDGRTCTADAADGLAASGTLYEQRSFIERDTAQKICELFDIKGLRASVVAEIEISSEKSQVTKYDKDGTVVRTEEETTSTEQSSRRNAGDEPGSKTNLVSNMPSSASDAGAGGAAGGETLSREDSHVKNAIGMGSTTTEKTTPAGKQTITSATIRVPRSHFIREWQGNNRSKDEPDETAFKAFADAESTKMKDQVLGIIPVKSADDVHFAIFVDDVAPLQPALATPPTGTMSTLLRGNVREIVIGGLAVASLFMVSMMVRRSSPKPQPPIVLKPTPAAAAAAVAGGAFGEEGLAGEVGGGLAAMLGREMDEETLQSSQMIEQVSSMVKENPDAAAQLIKRWLSRP